MNSIPPFIYQYIVDKKFITHSDVLKLRLIEKNSAYTIKPEVNKLISIDDIINKELYTKFYFTNIEISKNFPEKLDYIIIPKVKFLHFKKYLTKTLDLSMFQNITIKFSECLIIKLNPGNNDIISYQSYLNENNYNFDGKVYIITYELEKMHNKIRGNLESLEIFNDSDLSGINVRKLILHNGCKISNVSNLNELFTYFDSNTILPNLLHTNLEILTIDLISPSNLKEGSEYHYYLSNFVGAFCYEIENRFPNSLKKLNIIIEIDVKTFEFIKTKILQRLQNYEINFMKNQN
jgi:hypothetical protein